MMTAAGMAEKIQAQLAGALTPVAGEMSGAQMQAYQLTLLTKFCQGIINEIKANMDILAGGTHDPAGTGSHVHSAGTVE